MHHRFWFRLQQCAADLFASRHVASDECRALVDGPAMAFRQVVENDDVVPLIKQELDADAPDVACSANDKDFHPRQVRRAVPLAKKSPPSIGEGSIRPASSKAR